MDKIKLLFFIISLYLILTFGEYFIHRYLVLKEVLLVDLYLVKVILNTI